MNALLLFITPVVHGLQQIGDGTTTSWRQTWQSAEERGHREESQRTTVHSRLRAIIIIIIIIITQLVTRRMSAY